jgi:hypothetical protein
MFRGRSGGDKDEATVMILTPVAEDGDYVIVVR